LADITKNQKPVCSQCGSDVLKLIDHRPNYYVGARPSNYENPSNYTVAYQCSCGMAFTDTIKDVPPSSS
jgi:hypothetical protein